MLADELRAFRGRSDVVVLALPRGGVPVAVPLAQRLPAPLGVLAVRKVGVPGYPELAMGALASVAGRVELVRNEAVIGAAGITGAIFDEVAGRERAELTRRLERLGAAPVDLNGRVAMVVDDGLATGSTMLAAVAALRRQQPATVVIAVPVGSASAVALLSTVADSVVCPEVPEPFVAVGTSYADFTQVSDGEVDRLLGASDA